MGAPALVVLAAGLGRRFGGLKQFEPIGPHGEPLLDYAVFDALRAGFGRVVFVIREDIADAFEARVAARYRARAPIACAFQRGDDLPAGLAPPAARVRPWGTLHAVLAAREFVADGPFAVINADDFYGREAYARAAAFLGALPATPPHRCCMVGYRLAATLSAGGGVHRAVGVERGGFLLGLQEHRDIGRDADGLCRGTSPAGERVALQDDALVSMNFWGFAPSVLGPMAQRFADFLREHAQDPVAECLLPDFVGDALRRGDATCRVLDGGDVWFGITHAQDKAACVSRVAALTAGGEYPAALWGAPPGVTLHVCPD